MKLHLKKAATAAIAAAALTLTACGGSEPQAASGAGGGTLTLGSLADIQSFDPAQAHLGHQMPIYQASYDTLIRRMPEGELSPMLATDWSYNKDRTELTLDLRTDVTFSDGTEFDAKAAKANLDHFLESNGPDAFMAGSIDSVSVVDQDTIDISLKEPDPAMLYYLSQAPGLMGSPKALGTDGIERKPVGSGPYVFDKASSVTGSQYVFTKSKDYWNPDIQKFDRVVFKVLPDITARTNALVSGQIDGVLLDPKTGKQAEGAGMTLSSYQVDWQGLLLFDRGGEINPALKDVRVRKAINYAFDRKTILEQMFLGQGTPTTQVFGPESGAYVEELDKMYPYNPQKAKELLAEAGYPDGFTLKMPSIPGFDAVLAVVRQQLADVGITLKLQPVPNANYVADISGGKYAAALFQVFQGEPWVSTNVLIAESAIYNPFGSTTPELQKLIDQVQTGGEDSAELAKAVNRYVTENAWFAPFYRMDQMYYSNSQITVVPQTQQAVPSIYNYAPAK
ncbi:MAG TPA: ABC transporter substrate-binding protein [Arthrobacter sp.]|nr:ABC transporter substrate-binding protein [Arthrobacter sp.]